MAGRQGELISGRLAPRAHLRATRFGAQAGLGPANGETGARITLAPALVCSVSPSPYHPMSRSRASVRSKGFLTLVVRSDVMLGSISTLGVSVMSK